MSATAPAAEGQPEAKARHPALNFVTPICLAVAAGVAWVGSGGGLTLGAVPLLVVCATVAMAVQWVAYVPSYLKQTEHYYDLTGSLTYLAVVAFSLGVGATQRDPEPRQLIASALVAIWAMRLGSFLFQRVKRAGKDGRFDHIKPDPIRFLNAWTLQGLWVFLTSLAVVLLNTRADTGGPLGAIDALGFGVWGLGFGIEVVADRQKTAFNGKPENKGRFIDEGLWSWSRHPNYFGEIVLWLGLFIVGAGVFEGGQWVAVLSPIFVAFLLTRVSGVPMLEERADKKWGGQADYEAYKERTPVLIPRPPRG